MLIKDLSGRDYSQLLGSEPSRQTEDSEIGYDRGKNCFVSGYSPRKARSARLKRDLQPACDIGNRAVLSAEHHDLEDLSLVIVTRQFAKFRVVQRRPCVQRVDGAYQRRFIGAPARRGGSFDD